LELRGHSSGVACVAFSLDGLRLATASDQIRIWDARNGELVREFKGHSAAIRWVAFSPDGRRLATVSNDFTAQLWDVANGTSLLYRELEDVSGIIFSPDGKLLATAARDGAIKLWNAINGQLIRGIGSGAGKAGSLAFSPDGRQLAAVSPADDMVGIW